MFVLYVNVLTSIVCQNADMEQAEQVGDLGLSVGYVLKQVHASLRTAMDEALRPLELTVPQYACLELLGQNPGLSNSELARHAFVTRQSMNLVLRRLQERGLLTRPEQAPQGRALPTELTREGRALLRKASIEVRSAEKRLFSPLSPEQQRRIREELAACLDSSAVEQD
ncbi:DNA-binding transcriptional regulator, MarR family [Prauserella aidingensis]|nr:DNA-binding transcriptional regulator, MarR family [Prauserella aidingensis]